MDVNSEDSNYFDWKRDETGKPKRMDNGNYILVKNNCIYIGVPPDDSNRINQLLEELKKHNK